MFKVYISQCALQNVREVGIEHTIVDKILFVWGVGAANHSSLLSTLSCKGDALPEVVLLSC